MSPIFSRATLLQRQGELSAEKRRLLQERLRGASAPSRADPEVVRIPRRSDPARPVRLSFAQEQIWFLQQLDPEASTYNESTTCRVAWQYDQEALVRAFVEVQRRHELMRSTFPLIGDDPMQVVAPWPTGWQPVLLDLSHEPPEQREADLARFVRSEPLRPFHLEREFPWRAALVKLGEADHILHLAQHHIAYDGWSMEVFMRELLPLYAAFREGKPSPLPELSIQYADFAEWERERLQGPLLETKLDFWRTQLAGHQNLRLPTDRPRPALPTSSGATEWIELDANLVRAVAALAEAHNATPFMAYLAAFDVLLARYSAQTDIVLGTPVANRPRAELEGLIGIFLNSLVLRTDLSGDPTVLDVLDRVRTTVVEAFAHQDLPVEFLVTRVPFERDPTRSPLFQVVFNWQDWRHVPTPDFEMLPMTTGFEPPHVTAKFDLSVFLRVYEDTRVACGLEYNTDLFDRPTIQRLANHFQILLREVVTDPGRQISRLSLLDAAERDQIVVDWNATTRPYPSDQCIHELFEAQVRRTPSAPAVVRGDQQLTYAELNSAADTLADELRERGVGPETLVGLQLPRSLGMVVGVLGILKAGGAYVPLDPEYPKERLDFIRNDARLALVITEDGVQSTDAAGQVADGAGNEARVGPDNLAYIIYTSGSTGRPKGVQIPHRCLVNYATHARDAFDLAPATRVLQFASLSFDTAAEEIYPCLISGGTLVLREPDMLGSIEGFLARCEALAIQVLDLPTSYWHELVTGLADSTIRLPDCVRLVIIGGERALATDWAMWRQKVGSSVRLLNTYGPTEATIVALSSDLTNIDGAAAQRDVPIGRPVANAQAYIVDEHLAPVPIGVPGELVIGGAGVARGYLGQPELTRERFVADPFNAGQGRLYRTGDLARWRADGEVEYLGRIDQQVKVRGFRVEPAEVEVTLREHPGVRDCVVLAREGRLVAYVVHSAPADIADAREVEDLERFARLRLPDYMVPSAFVRVETLPLLPNGKLDRLALPALDLQSARERQYVAPRTPLEDTLADIWSHVLGVERIGIYDNFFVLGGHSLLAVRLAARVRRTLRVELPVRAIFEAPTLELLAQRIAKLPITDDDADTLIPRIERGHDEPLPLSYAQEALFMRAHAQPEDSSYNIAQSLHIEGALDVDALRDSLVEIVRRHEALRTRFVLVDDGPKALIAEQLDLPMQVMDLTEWAPGERSGRAAAAARALATRAFDLAAGPPFRVGLIRIDAQDWVLVFCAHHICFDGASLDVLCRELSELYRAASSGPGAGELAHLPELFIQYADYAAWQRKRVEGEGHRLGSDLAYWRERLDGAPALLRLPTDAPRPAYPSSGGATRSFSLAPDLTERVRAVQREEGATLFVVLLAAYQALLGEYSGQSDICVGVPVSTRDRDELHDVIGLFLNTVVLRTDVGGDPTMRTLIARTRDVVVGAMSHQGLPFEVLVRELQPTLTPGVSPIFQAMFTLHPAGRPGLQFGETRLSVVKDEGDTAKFDLTLAIDDELDTIRGQVEGRTDLFSTERIAHFATDYQALLESLVTQPDQRLSLLLRDLREGKE